MHSRPLKNFLQFSQTRRVSKSGHNQLTDLRDGGSEGCKEVGDIQLEVVSEGGGGDVLEVGDVGAVLVKFGVEESLKALGDDCGEGDAGEGAFKDVLVGEELLRGGVDGYECLAGAPVKLVLGAWAF